MFLKSNPIHFFDKHLSLANSKTLQPCPFGATCYRKNLLHFAEFSHPFNLLNPQDADSDNDDDDESTQKPTPTTNKGQKRKAESEEIADGDKTEEYNSDDVRR